MDWTDVLATEIDEQAVPACRRAAGQRRLRQHRRAREGVRGPGRREPGEVFCNHANRLKAWSYVKHTLFFGYCNGHGMYFPTIEAASEGGYGADPGVSLAELGAGERMMDKALLNIYLLQGKFARERR